MSGGIQPTYRNIWDPGTHPSTLETPGVGQFFIRLTAFATTPMICMGLRFFRDTIDGGNHILWLAMRNTPALRKIVRIGVLPQNPPGTGLIGWESVYFGSNFLIPSGQWFDVIGLVTGSHYSDNPGALSGGSRFVSANGFFVVPTDGATDPYGNVVANGAWDSIIRLNPATAIGGGMIGLDVIAVPAS